MWLPQAKSIQHQETSSMEEAMQIGEQLQQGTITTQTQTCNKGKAKTLDNTPPPNETKEFTVVSNPKKQDSLSYAALLQKGGSQGIQLAGGLIRTQNTFTPLSMSMLEMTIPGKPPKGRTNPLNQ